MDNKKKPGTGEQSQPKDYSVPESPRLQFLIVSNREGKKI